MKRHFEEPKMVTPMLSVEEEAVLQDEQSEAEIATASAGDDVDRVADVATATADTKEAVSQVEETTDVESALVASVADMAVAGTDADPDDVMSMDKADDTAMATESIAETLKKIWDAIVKTVKNFIVSAKHFFTTMFSSLEQNKKHAEKLIEKLSGMNGYVPMADAKVEMSDLFRLGSKTRDSMKTYLQSAEEKADTVTKYVFTALTATNQHIGKIADHCKAMFNDYPAKIDAVHAEIDRTAMEFKAMSKALGVPLTDDGGKSADQNRERISGFFKIEFVNAANFGDKDTPLETRVAFLSRARIEGSHFTYVKIAGSASVVELDVKDITPDQLSAKVKTCLDNVEKLLGMQNGMMKDLESKIDELRAACDQMLGRVGENQDNKKVADRMMTVVPAYGKWSTHISINAVGAMARMNKFWLSLFEKASNCYTSA